MCFLFTNKVSDVETWERAVKMTGIIICFVLPGVLIGLMLGEGARKAKEKARILEKERARKNRRQLYVYDLRNDQAA
jgi:hypothetical protein